MEATYRIDRDLRLVVSVALGDVTDEALLDHQRRLAADEDFEPDFRQLYDFRGATGLEATADGVRQLAENNPFGRGARRALVADNRAVYGMARMFQLMAEKGPDRVEVFDTVEAARKWLGLSDSDD